MFPPALLRRVVLLLPLAAAAACSTSVDVKEAIKLAETSGGWYDAGIVEGKNKIVPMASFRLQKQSAVAIDVISLNVVFRQPTPGANTEEDWDEVFLQNVQFSEGDLTAPLVVRPKAGYTGDPPQSRADLLKHSQFRDVRAHVYAKYSSTQWVQLGTIDIPRQLITR